MRFRSGASGRRKGWRSGAQKHGRSPLLTPSWFRSLRMWWRHAQTPPRSVRPLLRLVLTPLRLASTSIQWLPASSWWTQMPFHLVRPLLHGQRAPPFQVQTLLLRRRPASSWWVQMPFQLVRPLLYWQRASPRQAQPQPRSALTSLRSLRLLSWRV